MLALVAACRTGSSPRRGSAGSSQAAFKMAIVTDIGSLQDRSFNQLANEGRIAVGRRAQHPDARLRDEVGGGADSEHAGREPGRLQHDLRRRLPELQRAQRRRAKVPERSSTQASTRTTRLFKSKPKNAAGVIFAEHEAGYLVGYLAGLQIKKQGGPQIISAVGANNVPAIVRSSAATSRARRRRTRGSRCSPTTRTTPPSPTRRSARRRRSARSRRARGSIFQVAGGCGLGALSAAKEAGIWGIGVDADQLYLGSHMMTSALKGVDQAVEDLTKLAVRG